MTRLTLRCECKALSVTGVATGTWLCIACPSCGSTLVAEAGGGSVRNRRGVGLP